MLHKQKWLVLTLVLIAAALLGTACTAQPEQVVVTVEVEGPEGETVVVTATPSAAEPAAAGPLAADGMVACQPLPELAFGRSTNVAAAAQPSMHTVRMSGTRLEGTSAQVGGDVYRVGVFEDVTTVNFFAANGPDNTVWNAYMLPMRLSLYYLSDRTFQLVPGAAAVETPEPLTEEGDFWVVEVPLREDITWSDGEPFTANDVAYTAEVVKQFELISGNWVSWYDFSYLDHIEAVDDYTAKLFYHTKPGLARHEQGVLQAPVLAEHYWRPLTDAAADQTALFAISPDGEPLAGTFLFTAWEPGAFLEAAANPDFFKSGVTVQQFEDGTYQELTGGAVDFTLYGEGTGEVEVEWEIGPSVSAAIYTVYGSQDAALLALRNGDVDFVLNPLGLQRGLAEQLTGDPNVEVIENSVNGFRYLSFNNRRQPMNYCSFRQALSVLIDKEFVTNTVLQGVAFPLYTFVPEGNAAWYFDDVPKLGQGLSREERVNLAVAILEQDGFSWEGDVKPTWDPDNLSVVPGGRLILPDGTPVPELDLWSPSAGYDPLRSTFAIWIETWAREMGIPVTAKLAGFNQLVPRIFTEQDFDMYILGWSLSIFPSYLNDFFDSEQAVLDGNNAGGYENPEFDALGEELLVCDSLESCKEASDAIQLMLATEAPYVLLFDTGIIEAYRSASVEYPYLESLSGLQYAHQYGSMQSYVTVIE